MNRRQVLSATTVLLARPGAPHRPGDRWQHRLWPRGTPDAVVGEVKDGYVRWSARGGSETPDAVGRYLTAEYG